MELSEGIRRLGFRRWYERQLVESHLYLVTALLCLILVLACLEGFRLRAPGLEPLLRLAAMFAGGLVGLASLNRYLSMLRQAWRAAERSVCGKCEAYGILEVTSVRAGAGDRGADAVCAPTGVRCRRCGHEWTIE